MDGEPGEAGRYREVEDGCHAPDQERHRRDGLHAGFNTANAAVILRDEDDLVEGAYLAMQLSLTVVLLAVAVALVHLTHGRLGLSDGERPGGHP